MTTNLALRAGRDIAYHTERASTGHSGGMRYYTEAAGEPPGQWAGKAAARHGLTGDVDAAVIHRLYHQNITPDGELLAGTKAKNAEGAEEAAAAYLAAHPFASGVELAEVRFKALAKVSVSRPYFDFALGAVKSVSLLHASLLVSAVDARKHGDEDTAVRFEDEAARIENALLETARVVVREVEASAAYTRTGHHSATSGEYRDAAGVTAAIFVQHTSHEGDPHLHAHVTVHNRVQRADSADVKWRTLDSRVLYGQRLRIAALADREMETRMTGLGWQMEMRPDGNGAEVKGVGRDVIEMFSTRRTEMLPEVRELAEEYRQKYGHEPNARTLWNIKQFVSMRQRAASPAPALPADGQLAAWEAQTTSSEVQALSVLHQDVRAVGYVRAEELDEETLRRTARIAVAEVQKHHAAWTLAQLIFEIGRALPVLAEGADSKAVIEEVARLAISGRCDTDVVRVTAPDLTDVSALGVRDSDGGSIYRAPQSERYATLAHIDVEEHIIAGAKRPVPQLVSEADARAAVASTDLNTEQAEAVVSMLTAVTATTMLVAPAGSGKSHTMAQFARLWTTFTGRRVIGLTTSTNAAEVLKTEGLAESYNIAQFLGKIQGSDELRHPVPLHEGDVLVLDEATQIGTSDWAMIAEFAGQAGARLTPTGDLMQIGAVEAGGTFSLLAGEVPVSGLHEIRRFRSAWEGPASVQLRAGDFDAVSLYDTRGRIRGADSEASYAQAVGMWLGDYLEGLDVLLLAGSNAEAAELSHRVQEKLIALGKVTDVRAPLSDGNHAGTGDLIRARLNSHIDAGGRRLTNRDTLRIIGWAGPFAVAQRKIGAGWSDSFRVPVEYLESDAELQYGGNVFTAQGKTVDKAHLLVSETLSRPTFYVGMTRGRLANIAHVITGDTAAEGRQPYEQATPQSVVKSILQREPEDLSAIAQIRQSQEWTGGTGHVLTMWAAATRDAVYPFIDSLIAGRMGYADYDRYKKEHARPVLQNKLREAQMAGHDIRTLVNDITASTLDGARSISGVLHKRLETLALPDRQDATWASRTPESAPQLAHELAAGLDDRVRALGERMIEDPQPWVARYLGVLARDASPALYEDYAERAGRAASYREAAGITDPEQAVGHPHRDNPELETARRAALAALQVVDEETAIRTVARGELEARIQHGQRVTAAAPPETRAELRATAIARADASRDAADAAVSQDELAAEEATARAAELAAEQARLEALQAAYEEWAAMTRVERNAADAAKAELDRRGVVDADGQVPEADPEPELESDGPEAEADGPEVEATADEPEIQGAAL